MKDLGSFTMRLAVSCPQCGSADYLRVHESAEIQGLTVSVARDSCSQCGFYHLEVSVRQLIVFREDSK